MNNDRSKEVRVLLGTTNPAKIRRFSELLKGYAVSFYTLRDLDITAEPEENGATPEENAVLKARFYSRWFDTVLCNDSGLYFSDLPMEDPRQPGLNIRTPKGKRLDDEEMIAYYAALVRSLGGSVPACYIDGLAVCKDGKISSFMETGEVTRLSTFYMVDVPCEKRRPGWPLDSLSLNRKNRKYFLEDEEKKTDCEDEAENIILGEYRRRMIAFLAEALQLQRKEE